jgi:D-alanyl-D-alanine carboxypeptidase/D-alanyl-D-alanine-endopeptidase (penicillin-binding protein 4)
MALRALPWLLAALALAAPASASADSLRDRLARDLEASGPKSGAYVKDLTTGRVLFARRAGVRRVMMSNTKLFTTGAGLEAFGPRKRFSTTALGAAEIGADGVLAGDLYLRGGGDPTLAPKLAVDIAFNGAGTPVEDLVAKLKAAGLRRVAGGVVGDGSLFDSELGPPQWQLNSTPPGPVGALQYNRGINGTGPNGPIYVSDPAAYAAAGLRSALIAAGVPVDGAATSGRTSRAAVRLAAVQSPTLATLVRLINKPSDNLLAETLAKLLGRRTSGHATRKAGVAAALRFGRKLGVRAEIHTGSGAFPFPRAAPRSIVKLLVGLRRLKTFPALRASLPIAGRDGTLADRMKGTPAQGRCRAKTGTNESLSNQADQASVLSGYCSTRSGRLVVFSIMMNAFPDVPAARALQDDMVAAIAKRG